MGGLVNWERKYSEAHMSYPWHSINFCFPLIFLLGFPGDEVGKESACTVGDPGLVPGGEDPLEKEVATHSSILA